MTNMYQFIIIGVMDSSGLKFTFTSDPQRHRAAILTTGYSSTNFLVIPPGRESHTINSVCSSECTQKVLYYYCHLCYQIYHNSIIILFKTVQYFPPEGITVFGNMLHTHLTGNINYKPNQNLTNTKSIHIIILLW